jgi:hypothetical protein
MPPSPAAGAGAWAAVADDVEATEHGILVVGGHNQQASFALLLDQLWCGSIRSLSSNPNTFLFYNPQVPVKRLLTKQRNQPREYIQDMRFVLLPQA